jgi:hypothetical protein
MAIVIPRPKAEESLLFAMVVPIMHPKAEESLFFKDGRSKAVRFLALRARNDRPVCKKRGIKA